MKCSYKNKKAFTLVELLVVISIIALLLAVLMPALSKARDQGRKVICMSNSRQIGVACISFALENNDWLPMFDGFALSNDPASPYKGIYPHQSYWYVDIAPYMDYANLKTKKIGFFSVTSGGQVINPETALTNGFDAPRSLTCPSITPNQIKGSRVAALAYGWNWHSGGYCWKSGFSAASMKGFLPRRLSTVTNRGTAGLLGENRWELPAPCSKFAWADTPGQEGQAACVAAKIPWPQYYYGKRHFDGGVYICADGHAEYDKYANLAKDWGGDRWQKIVGTGPRVISDILPKR